MSDKESNNYHRLITLVVKTGTRTFREVLKKHTDDDITSVLKKHRNQLKSNRALTDFQYQLLNADTPDLEKFDISLLFILIRNICTTVETPPGNGWETAIVPRSDTTVGGYIIRIRNVRDEVVGHSSDARVSNDLFKKNWAEAEKCLKGLAAHVGFLDEIDKDIKNTESMHLTTDSNINLEATLMKWRVEELFPELAQLNEKADGHATNLQTVMDDVSLLRKQIEGGHHTGNSGSANHQTAPDVNKFMLIVNKEMDQTKNVLENIYDGVCKALGIYATQPQQTKALPPIVNPNALTEEEIVELSQELDWQYFTRKGSRPGVISGMMEYATIYDHWNIANKMNWLKGIRVMEITDEAIRPFVVKEIAKFHLDITSEFRHSSLCGRCRSSNASWCSSRICNDITSHIKSVHRYGKPRYKNSDITQWLYNPWEIAKCYMSRSKDLEGKPESDIDFRCVLNVVINNTRFQRLISAVDMTNSNNIFCQGRKAINEFMHSGRYRLTAHDLNHYCDIFIDIVNQIGTDKAECVREIEKVRDTSLSITEKDIANIKEQAASYQRSAKAALGELKKKEREETIKVMTESYEGAAGRANQNFATSIDSGHIEDGSDEYDESDEYEDDGFGIEYTRQPHPQPQDLTQFSEVGRVDNVAELGIDGLVEDVKQLGKEYRRQPHPQPQDLTQFSDVGRVDNVAELGIDGHVEDVEQLGKDICDKIKDLCKNLKDEQGNNVKVVACRNQDSFDLTVISNDREMDKDIIVNQCKEYKKHLRIDIRNVTDEGYRVMHSDVFMECIESEIFFQDMNRINTIISNNSKSIYRDAQHVNSVFFSPVRSVGHMANDHKMLKEPCIVVYVDVKYDKGRVPIDCIKIPQWIEGVRTDVQEGMANFLMKSYPTDYNNPVTAGCQISTSYDIQQVGSMGPIINMGQGKVGFLTSLHVLLTKYWYDLCFKGPITIDDIPNRSVYQPVDDRSECGRQKVGHIEFLKCSSGCESRYEPGFEVAVVELHTPRQTDGGFPKDNFDQTDYTETNPMEYTCGETLNMTEKDWRTMVEKFGANTGYTMGKYVSHRTTKINMCGDDFEFACQMIIVGTKLDMGKAGKATLTDFAKPGDSGSLVLMKENGQLKAVGIVIGICTDGACFVTPIKPICDELHKKGWSLQTFKTQCNNNDRDVPMDSN